MATLQDPVQEEARQIPSVPSPYEGQRLSAWQHVNISAYWFATNFLWGALLFILLPAEIQHLMPWMKAKGLNTLNGSAAIVPVLVPLIVGALSDRCASRWGRRRPYMAVGLAINVVGLALMAFAYEITTPIHGEMNVFLAVASSPGLIAFVAGYLVVQLGNNITSAAYMGVIPDVIPSDQRGVASGYMALMSQAGTLLGIVVTGMLLHGQPETVKYAVLALILVATAMVTLLGLREVPLPSRPPKLAWGPYLRSLWIDPRRYPDFAWVWITRSLVMLGFYAVLPNINYYLVDVIGVPQKDVGTKASFVVGLILVTSTISALIGGNLSDRYGRKRIVTIANVSIAVLALSFIFCRSLLDVLIAGSIFGLGYGVYISVDYALGTDVLPSKKDAAKEMAVWHIAMTLPQTLAGYTVGYLIAGFGKQVLPPPAPGEDAIVHYSLNGYSALFVVCAVCFALSAYFLRNVRNVR